MSTKCTWRKIKQTFIFAVIFSLLFSCSTDEEVKNLLRERKVLNIGHAGMGFTSLINPFNAMPDNSMAALREAMLAGADGVEVDVQLSKDSILLLYHDRFLESKTTLSGCISDHFAEDVKGAAYKMGFPFDLFHEEVIISLDSLFAEFNTRDTFPWIYLDFHSYNYCDSLHRYGNIDRFARALARSMRKYQVPVEKICPTSTYVPMLMEIKKSVPGIKLYFEEDADYERGLRTVLRNNIEGIVIKQSLIPGEDRILAARKKGIEVVFFGGKAKGSIEEMLLFYPDVIQVNNVRAFKEIIDEAGE